MGLERRREAVREERVGMARWVFLGSRSALNNCIGYYKRILDGFEISFLKPELGLGRKRVFNNITCPAIKIT